jgi:ferredoxin
VQTAFTAQKCIECDACIDVCPTHCLTITPNTEGPGEEAELRQRLTVPALNLKQDIYVSSGLPQTGRVMVKDEDLCVHCGLCAERCPTAAWDMQKFDLHLPYAGKPVAARTLPPPAAPAPLAVPPAPPAAAAAAAAKPSLPIA